MPSPEVRGSVPQLGGPSTEAQPGSCGLTHLSSAPVERSNLLVSVLTAFKTRSHSREIPLKCSLQVTQGKAGPEEGLSRSSHTSRHVYGHQVSIPGRSLHTTKPSCKGIPHRAWPSSGVWCTCEALRPTGSTAGRDHNTEVKENLHTMERKYINHRREHCSRRVPRPSVQLCSSPSSL